MPEAIVRRLYPMLAVDDLQKSLAFYRDLLGGVETYRFPAEGEPGYVALRLGESALGLGLYTEGSALHGLPQKPASGHRMELCVYVDDVDAAVERLRAAGAPVHLEPSDQPWGERIAYVEDPDGNLLMLTK